MTSKWYFDIYKRVCLLNLLVCNKFRSAGTSISTVESTSLTDKWKPSKERVFESFEKTVRVLISLADSSFFASAGQ